ncbi:MAG: hypothetical protein ACK40L_11965 [Hydrogenophaga sp.]
MKDDLTLTAGQASSGGFRPNAVGVVETWSGEDPGNFRSPSTPTSDGHRSGYHEAFVTTSTFNKLASSEQVVNPYTGAPFGRNNQVRPDGPVFFPSDNLSALLRAGDGARADTARSILSMPDGRAAGHSGSHVSTVGQAEAHSLLDAASLAALCGPELSQEAMGVLAGAVTIFSNAPGELAAATEGATSLKDQRARQTWEADRNEAKRRLYTSFARLGPEEQQVVMAQMQALAQSTAGHRELMDGLPFSPIREQSGSPHAPIRGGTYDHGAGLGGEPQVGSPGSTQPQETAAYITQPLRAPRRQSRFRD